jgi:hypothetical protein
MCDDCDDPTVLRDKPRPARGPQAESEAVLKSRLKPFRLRLWNGHGLVRRRHGATEVKELTCKSQRRSDSEALLHFPLFSVTAGS